MYLESELFSVPPFLLLCVRHSFSCFPAAWPLPGARAPVCACFRKYQLDVFQIWNRLLLLSSKPCPGLLFLSKSKPKSLPCPTGHLGSSELSRVDAVSFPFRQAYTFSCHWAAQVLLFVQCIINPTLRTLGTPLHLPGMLSGSLVTHSLGASQASSCTTGGRNVCHLQSNIAYFSSVSFQWVTVFSNLS